MQQLKSYTHRQESRRWLKLPSNYIVVLLLMVVQLMLVQIGLNL